MVFNTNQNKDVQYTHRRTKLNHSINFLVLAYHRVHDRPLSKAGETDVIQVIYKLQNFAWISQTYFIKVTYSSMGPLKTTTISN